MPGFADRLLKWFRQHQRDLPWRRSRDPWAIWVSEIMLQQTRVDTVREPYERFLTAFPTPDSFATCSDDELQRVWRGLGYYRRARLLREGARAVVERHGGRVPSDPEALGRLPGIGAYTRGAVGSIAFGTPEPAVDGNVERVIARHSGIGENVKRAPGAGRVRDAVAGHLDRDHPGDFNQALMELGATVCSPRSPRCSECPVASDCRARIEGTAESLPVLPQRRASVRVSAVLLAIPRRAGLLARWIPAGEINEGQWELPGPGLLTPAGEADDVPRVVHRVCGARVKVGALLGTFSHGITHHRISVAVHAAETTGSSGVLRPTDPHDPAVPWTTASRKAFRAMGMEAGRA